MSYEQVGLLITHNSELRTQNAPVQTHVPSPNHKPDLHCSDLFHRFVFDRWSGALRPSVLLRLYGQRLRMVPNAGHVRKCVEQTCCGSVFRILCRLDCRPLWSSPADVCGNTDGGTCPDRPRSNVDVVDVLLLLSDQCPRLCLRRPAAESNSVVAAV